MNQYLRDGLCFDDVLLIPEYSTVESRSKVDISVKLGKFTFSHPIIPANMKTVTGKEMAIKILEGGGLAILHRFMSQQEQLDIAKSLLKEAKYEKLSLSIGIKDSDKETVAFFKYLGGKIICIDIAHGDSSQCVSMIQWIKKNHPELLVIAGNVATGSGARRLWEAGADVVKVGIGPGSLCTTRIETGNGVPQLSALMEVAEVQKQLRDVESSFKYPDEEKRTFPFIADGGIKSAGDIVKALCFADMVMVGNLFAGCEEAPGEISIKDGISYKKYVGSSTHKSNHVEGVEALVPLKGPANDILNRLIEGLRSGCSYQGSWNLTSLKDKPRFVKITGAGLKESHPHDVFIK